MGKQDIPDDISEASDLEEIVPMDIDGVQDDDVAWEDPAATTKFDTFEDIESAQTDRAGGKYYFPAQTKIFDFRNGDLPEGVELVGEGKLETAKNGSTYLRLKPGAYLKVSLGIETEQMKELKKKAAQQKKKGAKAEKQKQKEKTEGEEDAEEGEGGKEGVFIRELINRYTLTMDVLVDEPPQGNGISLYQASWPERHYTDECYLSQSMGVGLDENFGPEDVVPVGAWSRVNIAVGDGTLVTYVKGKKCTTVSKRELGHSNGRFAVDPDGILLFASTGKSHEVCVKYVRFSPVKQSDADIKGFVHIDTLYSQWNKDRQCQSECTKKALTLSALFSKAYPMWLDSLFWGEFCDPFLSGTALRAYSLVQSLKVLHHTNTKAFKEQEDWLGSMQEHDVDFCLGANEDLKRSIFLAKRYQTLVQSNNLSTATPQFLSHMQKQIDLLGNREALIIPFMAPVLFVLIKTGQSFRFVVCRGGEENSYHPAMGTQDSKVKFKGAVAIDNVSEAKISDCGFWSVLYTFALHDQLGPNDEKLYSVFLPWLSGKPYYASIADTVHEPSCQYRTPGRSQQLGQVQSLLEVMRYLCLWRGVSEKGMKEYTFILRRQILKFCIQDLTCVQKIRENDRNLIRIACQQFAHNAIKRAKSHTLSPLQLSSVKADIDALEGVITNIPVVDDMAVNPPPLLSLDTTMDRKTTWFKHPLMDRLLRPDDVDGLAGPPRQIRTFVPINFLRLPTRVTTFQEALDALRYCDLICTSVTEQQDTVKHHNQLRAAIIQHTLTVLVPLPRSRADPDWEACLWAQPCHYRAQLDTMLVLRRLTEHYTGAVLFHQDDRYLHATHVVVTGAIMCIADAMMRKIAIDIPSAACEVLAGTSADDAYGVGLGYFPTVTETMWFHTPELAVARTSIMDYFTELDIKEENQIFTWERGMWHHGSLDTFMEEVSGKLGWKCRPTSYVVADDDGYILSRNYPELTFYRDIVFHFKMSMWTGLRDTFASGNELRCLETKLKWEYDISRDQYRVFVGNQQVSGWANRSRYASEAEPSNYTFPQKVTTEDDILHIKTLPDFGGMLNQRDSELLLSYLTVPYMRVPLVLSFFATGDRVHTLRSTALQSLLDAVLFEPQKLLKIGKNMPPAMVPTEDREILACPYGLLMNELHRSPESFIQSLMSLLKQSLECDSGVPDSTEADLILYTIRTACRIEGYMSFLASHAEGTHPSMYVPLRDVQLSPYTIGLLKDGLRLLQDTLRGDVRNMLENWIGQFVRRFRAFAKSPHAVKRQLDRCVTSACRLHAHLVLIFRNVTKEEWNIKYASTMLSSFMYLTNRHTWNSTSRSLQIPENEVWNVMQAQRPSLIQYVNGVSPNERHQILEAIIRVTTDSGDRVMKANDTLREWDVFAEGDHVGRYGRMPLEWTPEQREAEKRAEEERREKERQERELKKKRALHEAKRRAKRGQKKEQDKKPHEEPKKVAKAKVPRARKQDKELGQLDLELNLQTLQLTLRNSDLRALPQEIHQDKDVKQVFADTKDSMQCAVVDNAQHREWLRLVGREHDIHYWLTEDHDVAELLHDREYDPGDLAPSEKWILDLFEPVRLALFNNPFNPIPIVMPDEPVAESAGVAHLIAVHPKKGGAWHEIFVYRHWQCVQIYQVFSYGRRFYRSLWFTTDVRCTLRKLTPSLGKRCRNPPMIFRYAAHNSENLDANGTGCVVTREPVVPENLSGTEEMFIPKRLLYGLIPETLLEQYQFWQDDNDNIRGYPQAKSLPKDHHLYIHMDPASQLDHDQVANSLCGQVKMIPNKTKDGTKSSVESEMLLLNLLYAPEGTALHSLAKLMTRLDNLSHVLAWTKNSSATCSTDQLTIDVVHLPRLKLTFKATWDPVAMEMKLQSLDHANMFVSNVRNDLVTDLCRGIPHCILLANPNDEIRMLVPAVKPVRPSVASEPFSTELVLDRSNEEWNRNLETPYYLYNVHISMSFLHCPTLASTLYLLWLRLAFRDYADATRLVDSIATDMEFSPEELATFEHIGSLQDGHPNYFAVMCKISHVVMNSPLFTPWYLPEALQAYIASICHVSAQCQLTIEEQVSLLAECETLFKKERVIQYIATEKFHLRTFKNCYQRNTPQKKEMVDKYLSKSIYSALGLRVPIQELHFLLARVLQEKSFPAIGKCLLRNRANQIEALENGNTSFRVLTPPRGKESYWNIQADTMSINAKPYSWQYIGRGFTKIEYNPPKSLAGATFCDVVAVFAQNEQTMEGSYGFLFLYELLKGKIKFKMGKTKDPSSAVFLLAHFINKQKRCPQIFRSILDILQLNPSLIPSLPDFCKDDKDKSKKEKKKQTITGKKGEVLDQLLTGITAAFQSASADESLLMPVSKKSFATVPKPPSQLPVPKGQLPPGPITKLPCDMAGKSPGVANFMCGSRKLEPVAASALEELCDPQLAAKLAIPQDKLKQFVGIPLEGELDLEKYTTWQTQGESTLPIVQDSLTFDVSKHPDAHSLVAKDMLARLEDDAKIFAERENGSKKPKLRGLLDHNVESMAKDPSCASLQDSIARLTEMHHKLRNLRDIDSDWVTAAIPVVQQMANFVFLPTKIDGNDAEDDDATARYIFFLRRYCGHETFMWLELIVSFLLSVGAKADWEGLNPYVSSNTYHTGICLVTALLLKANRVGHLNRLMEMSMEMIKMLQQLQASTKEGNLPAPQVAGMVQKADILAATLMNARHYIDKDTLEFDPRFLVFEFTWNIMLRKEQVAMVKEFTGSLAEGRSLVKQMIMGAGKTTVVSPLLSLMLADCKSLVMEVVPAPLLEFSRSVHRKIFSSVIRKRIFTFVFDRSTEPDISHVRKLQAAVKHGGIVVASSVAIKSVMLKFIEALDHINDPTRPRTKQLEKDKNLLASIIRLFQQGTLIMDEVDLILHPLKSELNFPTGPRFDLDMSPLRWRMPVHLLDAIFAAESQKIPQAFKDSTRAVKILEEVKVTISEGYICKAFQGSPHLVLLNSDYYVKNLKPLLADWLLLWLEAQQLTGISHEMTHRYLMNGYDDKEASAAVDAMVNGSTFAPDEDLMARNVRLLNLGHDWLTSFMPHILQKIDRVSFGIMTTEDYEKALEDTPHMPLSRWKLAIPFEGKDVPSRASEFAHPDIIIGLTILAYRYEGLRQEDFLEVVQSMKSTLEKEPGPYHQRKSTLRYEQWVKEAGGSVIRRVLHKEAEDQTEEEEAESAANTENEVVSLRLLKQSNKVQMDRLYNLFRSLPNCIHWYLNDFIFPTHTPHQVIKLSASGQEVGGSMLFGKRIGFSGTPSDLLPQELGRCGYELGTDGLMMHTLQSPKIVSSRMIEAGWTVNTLLDSIAYADPPFHALIDTGALITGMSNKQVAEYLLKPGRLQGFQGVVFLDELGRKVVLLRATGRVVLLEECGMSLEKRFAFYDQIHTTGMDITHTPNARAALTIGKDMTFRDYSQGAFRMRGILRGQSIQLFIIPEILELMHRDLAVVQHKVHANMKEEDLLCSVCAWLMVCSMRSERIQFNQLCIQNVANVWRNNGFSALLESHNLFSITKGTGDPRLCGALEMYRESVGFSIASTVGKPKLVTDLMKEMREGRQDFIVTDEDHGIINDITHSLVKAAEDCNRTRLQDKQGKEVDDDEEELARDSSERIFNAEIVQEKAQEKEQQREQVIEIEKEEFVDRMYSRDQEKPSRWAFDSLANTDIAGCFYPANTCALHLRQPIAFPDYMYISNNYFDKRWAGDRRLKNVVMVLEWCPDRSKVQDRENPCTTPAAHAKEELLRALKLLLWDSCTQKEGPITKERLQKMAELCFEHDTTIQDDTLDQVSDVNQVVDTMYGSSYRKEHAGRYFVAVSLAEAETIRRVLHTRAESQIIPGADVGLALRCVPADFYVMDSSWQFQEKEYPMVPAYQKAISYQSFRFFDCDVQYQDSELNVLLKAVQTSTKRQRSTYFQQILGCRRRIQKQWDTSPVTKVFNLGNEFEFLHSKIQCLKIRESLNDKKVSLYDAFCLLNDSKSGLLSAGEIMGGFKWMALNPELKDVIDFMKAADQDQDGKLSFSEFWDAVCDPRKKLQLLEEEDELATTPSAPEVETTSIPADSEQELAELKRELKLQHEREEVEEQKRQEEEDRYRTEQVALQHDEFERQAGRPPNPHIFTGSRPKPDRDAEEKEKERKKQEIVAARKKMMRGFRVKEEEEKKEDKEAKKSEEVVEVPEESKEQIPYEGTTYNFTTGKTPKWIVQYGFIEYRKAKEILSAEALLERKRKQIKVGTTVEIQNPSGFYWDREWGVVQSVNSDGSYGVEFDSGNIQTCLLTSILEFSLADEDDWPTLPYLHIAANAFLKVPLLALPSGTGNGGGKHLNSYTISLLLGRWSSKWNDVLFKTSLGFTARLKGTVCVDGLSLWDKRMKKCDDVEWDYEKHGKWNPFSFQQTEELEKEYKKNQHGSVALEMDKATMLVDFGLLKMVDEKTNATFGVQRTDAESRWRARFSSHGFTEEILEADPSVDWMERLESKTEWDDAEEAVEDRKEEKRFGGWSMGTSSFMFRVGEGRSGSDSDWSDDNDFDSWLGWGNEAWGLPVGKVRQGRWHHIVVSVNLGESAKITTYVDGVESERYHDPDMLGDIDGQYSLPCGDSLTLLGGVGEACHGMNGGGLQHLKIKDYAASREEVERMYKEEHTMCTMYEAPQLEEEGDDELLDEEEDEEYY